MNYETEKYMEEQEAHLDMLSMRKTRPVKDYLDKDARIAALSKRVERLEEFIKILADQQLNAEQGWEFCISDYDRGFDEAIESVRTDSRCFLDRISYTEKEQNK